MQSDTPQGDPRLQRINPEPEIATGFVDPCIVYIETSFGGLPLLIVCFAASSYENGEPGQPYRLELRDALVLRCEPNYDGSKGCHFVLTKAETLIMDSKYLSGLAPCRHSAFNALYWRQVAILRQSIRPIDRSTAANLKRRFESAHSPNFPLPELAIEMVKFGKIRWRSVLELVYNENDESKNISTTSHSSTRRRRRPSLVRRLLSSVFKKKPQPAHA